MSDTYMKLKIWEVGIVRVVGAFHRSDTRSRWEFREAIVEMKTKDALNNDRWENCNSMTYASVSYENKLAFAIWCAFVDLADVALKEYMASLVGSAPVTSGDTV